MNSIYICASKKNQKEHGSFLEDLRSKYILKDINDCKVESDSIIIVLGGDGSLNYLLNNIDKLDNQRVIYFPLGTANDFARSLKLDPIKPSLAIVDEVVRDAPIIDVPVMSCNEKYFINVVTGGALALVTESGSDILKQLTGKLSYYVGALEEIVSPESYSLTFKLSNSKEESITTNGFIVSQGLYAGGGVKVSPHFTPSFKKTFNFLTLESENLTSSLGSIVKMQQSDVVCDLSDSEMISEDIVSLTIKSESEIPIKLDGEEYSSKVLKFSKSENKLKFYQY